jgi:hypothetical protein
MTTLRALARRPCPVPRPGRRTEAAGCATSWKGHDHGTPRDARDCPHHCAHHDRRRGVRLQGIPSTNCKKVTGHISLQVTVGKKEAIPLTPLLGRLALFVDIAADWGYPADREQ